MDVATETEADTKTKPSSSRICTCSLSLSLSLPIFVLSHSLCLHSLFTMLPVSLPSYVSFSFQARVVRPKPQRLLGKERDNERVRERGRDRQTERQLEFYNIREKW